MDQPPEARESATRVSAWFRRVLGLSGTAGPSPEDDGEAAVRLIRELEGRLPGGTPPPLVRQRVARFLAAERAERTASLPSLYLLLEQYLTEMDPVARVDRHRLRAQVRADYPTLQGDRRFAIIFENDDQQELSLRREFLIELHHAAVSVVGPAARATFQSRLETLRDAPGDEARSLSIELGTEAPTSPGEWTRFMDRLSRDTYLRLRPLLGEKTAARLFEDAYQALAADFMGLDAFSGVVHALPEELVDEEKVRVLSKTQMRRLLMEKVRYLEFVNDILVERNEALNRARTEALLARDEADRANRAKSEFLSRMSHELRTPLNSVIGFTNVLLRRAQSLPERERSYLDRIRVNGLHLLELVNDILDLAKVEAGRVQPELVEVDLDSLLRETAAQLEPRVGPGVRLLVQPAEDAARPVVTDHILLKRVLINLVGNALKFTEKGSVTVSYLVDPEGYPETLEVLDTGVGISAELMEHIFEPFRQGEEGSARRWDGTGLGLAISQSLCGLLGYRISCESEPGRGSTFRVHLRPHELPRVVGPPDRGGNDPDPAAGGGTRMV